MTDGPEKATAQPIRMSECNAPPHLRQQTYPSTVDIIRGWCYNCTPQSKCGIGLCACQRANRHCTNCDFGIRF